MIDNSYHRVDSRLIFYEKMAFFLKLKIRYIGQNIRFQSSERYNLDLKAGIDKSYQQYLLRVVKETYFSSDVRCWNNYLHIAIWRHIVISFFFQKMKSETLKNRKKAWFFCDLTAHFCCLEGQNDFQIRFAVRFVRFLRSLLKHS